MIDFKLLLSACQARLNTDSLNKTAQALGVSRPNLTNMVNGINPYTAEMARALANFLALPYPVVYMAYMYYRAPTREESAGWLAAYVACQGPDYERLLREELEKKPLMAA